MNLHRRAIEILKIYKCCVELIGMEQDHCYLLARRFSSQAKTNAYFHLTASYETEQSEARQLVWSNNIVMFMFLVHRVYCKMAECFSSFINLFIISPIFHNKTDISLFCMPIFACRCCCLCCWTCWTSENSNSRPIEWFPAESVRSFDHHHRWDMFYYSFVLNAAKSHLIQRKMV